MRRVWIAGNKAVRADSQRCLFLTDSIALTPLSNWEHLCAYNVSAHWLYCSLAVKVRTHLLVVLRPIGAPGAFAISAETLRWPASQAARASASRLSPDGLGWLELARRVDVLTPFALFAAWRRRGGAGMVVDAAPVVASVHSMRPAGMLTDGPTMVLAVARSSALASLAGNASNAPAPSCGDVGADSGASDGVAWVMASPTGEAGGVPGGSMGASANTAIIRSSCSSACPGW